MTADLLRRKETHFVLWRPGTTNPPPALVIGRLKPGNPPSFVEHRQFDLQPTPGFSDLWEIAADLCGLQEGSIYHYWFEVSDSDPHRAGASRIWCTDPTAWTTATTGAPGPLFWTGS